MLRSQFGTRVLRGRRIALARALAVPLTMAIVAVGGAAAAPGDPIEWALPVGSLPAVVTGTTEDAQRNRETPVPSCSDGSGVVWYTTAATKRGPMLATVRAGETDAGLAVYRLKRSTREELICSVTDRYGTASVPWHAHPGQTLLIGVMRRATSKPGPYTLHVVDREAAPRPPGEPLAARGVTTTVAPLVDEADAWAVRMQRGTSYKLSLLPRTSCVKLGIYKPTGYSFTDAEPVERGTLECGGYLLFTPGIDGGGTYSLLATATGSEPGTQKYTLMVEAAGKDDTAPGIALTSGGPVSGALATSELDVVDLYSFTVPHENSLTTIDFRPGPKLRYDLIVLDETGTRVLGIEDSRGRQLVQKTIPSGRYFLVTRAARRSGGVYRLEVLTREMTSTTMYANGTQFVETSPDRSVPLQVSVTAARHGGIVDVEIDRFDPIFGWQFATVISAEVDSNGRVYANWLPPWAGHWRALARYEGNLYSTPSSSDYVRVHAAVPLET